MVETLLNCLQFTLEGNSLTFLRRVLVLMVIRWQLKIFGFAVGFMGKFSNDSGPVRHFPIDTGFALDIFTSLLLTLPRPWHVADLLGFSYFEKEKRGRICWNSFYPLLSPTFLLFKSTNFSISLFCCAAQWFKIEKSWPKVKKWNWKFLVKFNGIIRMGQCLNHLQNKRKLSASIFFCAMPKSHVSLEKKSRFSAAEQSVYESA